MTGADPGRQNRSKLWVAARLSDDTSTPGAGAGGAADRPHRAAMPLVAWTVFGSPEPSRSMVDRPCGPMTATHTRREAEHHLNLSGHGETREKPLMWHSNIDREAPAVKQFFETFAQHPGGSEFVRNGSQVVINVVPETEGSTDAEAARQAELRERDIQGAITNLERLELDMLQDELQWHAERTAPLPMDDARKLLRELVTKAPTAGRQ